MDAKKLIRGRKLLIVDDEVDVLEELIDLLTCAKSTPPPLSRMERCDSKRATTMWPYWTLWG